MDKRVMFAVAGAGKTTYIVNQLSTTKRSLIVTYTNGNYDNLTSKISRKFDGKWPENVTLMTFFSFLYGFCYRPFLADKVKAKGVVFENNPNRFLKQTDPKYYLSPGGYFYSNRLSFFLEKMGVVADIKSRIEKYFDEFIIDEIQDIAGRDFSFLEQLMSANVNMLFVGVFFSILSIPAGMEMQTRDYLTIKPHILHDSLPRALIVMIRRLSVAGDVAKVYASTLGIHSV